MELYRREVALYCAKVLQLDIDRSSQSPFILFDGLKDHKDDTIHSMQDYIERRIDERLTVEDLSKMCFMDRVNFSRRFKKQRSILLLTIYNASK